jgi:exosome complex exonuclease DIS3/RRP44
MDLENDNPTDVQLYSLKESNSLVEEFMLLANITVSKKILRHYPSLSVLRRHQPPSREQFSPLVSAAASVGVVIDISSSKALADSLDAANLPGDPYFNKLLRILSTRCMMPAQYFCSGEIPKDQWHHYGLAAPIYTHFTSPIRRYPDILVHRLLASAIGAISLPAACSDRIKLQELCAHMNRRHKAAQYAQRASVSIHTLLFFHNRPVVECAYVLSVNINSISLLVPRYGIEGRISIQDYLSENFLSSNVEYDSIDHSIQINAETHNHKSQRIKLKVFQTVQVEIKVQSDSSGSKKLLINLIEIPDSSNKKVRDDSSDSMKAKKKRKNNKT